MESKFLNQIFLKLNKEKIEFCVERNYEGYPNIITGDIDLIVKSKDFFATKKSIFLVAKRLNWKNYIDYSTNQACHFGFYNQNNTNRFVLVIELFNGGTYKGLNFLSAETILKKRIPVKSFYKSCSTDELIITLIHHLFYNNKVFIKYRERILNNFIDDPILVEKKLSYILNKSLSKKICKSIKQKKWNEIEQISAKAKLVFFIKSLIYNPIKSLKGIITTYYDIKFKPKGIIIHLSSGIKDKTFLAKKMIEFATNYHIFIPPQKKIFFLENKIEYDKIDSVISSGGIAILIDNKKNRSENIFNSYEKFINISSNNDTLTLNYKSKVEEISDLTLINIEKLVWNKILLLISK